MEDKDPGWFSFSFELEGWRALAFLGILQLLVLLVGYGLVKLIF